MRGMNKATVTTHKYKAAASQSRNKSNKHKMGIDEVEIIQNEILECQQTAGCIGIKTVKLLQQKQTLLTEVY